MTGSAIIAQEQAGAVERRWEIATVGIAASVAIGGVVVGGRIADVLSSIGPLAGLVAVYVLRSIKTRQVPVAIAVAARLRPTREHSPWTWTLVFVLATWLVAEVGQGLVAFGVGASVALYGSLTPTGDLVVILNEIAPYLLVVAIVASVAAAVPCGYELGLRCGRRALRWVVIGSLLGRMAFLASALWAAAQLDSEVDIAQTLAIHVPILLAVLIGGLIGAWRGARRADAFQIAALYRSLPSATRSVAMELMREEAVGYLTETDPKPQVLRVDPVGFEASGEG